MINSLFKEFRGNISNSSSTGNALNKDREVQQSVMEQDFYTTDAAEKIYIGMRETLGYADKKNAIKRDDSTIVLKITLTEAVASDLQILIQGQRMDQYVYQKRQGGNLLKFCEYKINPDKKSR